MLEQLDGELKREARAKQRRQRKAAEREESEANATHKSKVLPKEENLAKRLTRVMCSSSEREAQFLLLQ